MRAMNSGGLSQATMTNNIACGELRWGISYWTIVNTVYERLFGELSGHCPFLCPFLGFLHFLQTGAFLVPCLLVGGSLICDRACNSSSKIKKGKVYISHWTTISVLCCGKKNCEMTHLCMLVDISGFAFPVWTYTSSEPRLLVPYPAVYGVA